MLSRLLRRNKITVDEEQLRREISLLTMIEYSTDNVSNHLYRIFYMCKHILESASEHDRFDEELDKDLSPILNSIIYHDIGKSCLYSVTNANEMFTPADRKTMEQHVITGGDLIKKGFPFSCKDDEELNFLNSCNKVIHTHHEKYDGTGYPDGLKGSEIPLIGRIMCLLDVFDALMENRLYNPATSLKETLVYLKSQSSKSFDPTLVEIFIDSIKEIKGIIKKYPYNTHG
jgi:putative two-component system response regulator